MCLLLISYKVHPGYPLIIAANRDEFYNRPTEKAHFWKNHPELLAGRDLEAGGTWLGVTKSGRFAAVTNYRDMRTLKDKAESRGELVTNFLLSGHSPPKFGHRLSNKRKDYNGYNLLFTDMVSLYYFSNQINKPQKLQKGIYGLSNHLLDTPWQKVLKGKEAFIKVTAEEKVLIDDLFKILSDDKEAPEDQLPDTGLPVELEKVISPVFVKSERYGTRASTILLINKVNDVLFIEKSLDTKLNKWEESRFEFKLEL